MSDRPFFPRIPLLLAIAAIGFALLRLSPPAAGADEEVLLNLTFDDKKVDEDLTAEWRFFAEGSETTPGLTAVQAKRQNAKFIVKTDPADPNNKVLWLAGGDTLLDDSFIYVPSLTNAEINKGDYTAIQLDFYTDPELKAVPQPTGPKKILKRAGPHRIGVFGFIDPNDKASYGAWMRWSDRQARVGRLVAGQEEMTRSFKLGRRKDCGRWYTIRADFTRQGDKIEVTGRMWDRTKGPTQARRESKVVPFSAKKTFAIGIYQYTCSTKFNYDKRFIDNLKVIRAK